MRYEALYYNGWIEPPAYYLLGEAEGESPQEAITINLQRLTNEVRRAFGLDLPSVDDKRIHESLYLLEPDSMVPIRNVVGL